MEAFSSALNVLSAMITPAVLISACGTLILSTSNRLIRVLELVRELSQQFEELTHNQKKIIDIELKHEKITMVFAQLRLMTHRARLLQRSMTIFYAAISSFIATSVAIGVVSIFALHLHLGWIPIVLALVGISLLLYGSLLMIFESHLALMTTYNETDFLWRMGRRYAPAELLERRQRPIRLFRR